MTCSEARRLANQRNSKRSTGPKSIEGKNVARLNSTTHGLRGEPGIVPPHLADSVANHTANLVAAYHPEGEQQLWMIGQAADAAARLDFCQLQIRALHAEQRRRAEVCWDEDRDRDLFALVARLPKDPARVARRLRNSAQGCLWMLGRWSVLGQAAAEQRRWTEPQIHQAFHLLGIADDQRAEHPYIGPEADPDELAEIVTEQVEALQSLYDEAMGPLDQKERELASLGIPLRASAEMNTLVRYEARLRRQFQESLAEFRDLRAEGSAGSIADCGLRIAESSIADFGLPIAESGQPTAAEPEPLPLSPIPQSAIGNPHSEASAIGNPHSEIPQSAIGNPQAEEKPVLSMLATVLQAVKGGVARPAEPIQAPRPPAAERPRPALNRKARRELEKAARKRARSH
jgi:hypothetical protein